MSTGSRRPSTTTGKNERSIKANDATFMCDNDRVEAFYFILKKPSCSLCVDQNQRYRHTAESNREEHLRLPGENLRSDYWKEVRRKITETFSDGGVNKRCCCVCKSLTAACFMFFCSLKNKLWVNEFRCVLHHALIN